MNPIKVLTLLIISGIAIVEMATDMYVPNLTNIMSDFGVDEGAAQLTISINLVGLALSSLFYGPLSNCIGRKKVILFGLTVFTAASLSCALSTSYAILLISRLTQGLGGGAAVVVGLASIRDVYKGTECVKVMAMISMVIAISPGLAPLIGGYIGSAWGWSSIFMLLSGAGLISILCVKHRLTETLEIEKREHFNAKYILSSYAKAFGVRLFMGYNLIQALVFAELWIVMGNLPVIFIQELGVQQTHYGIYWIGLVVAYVLGVIYLQKNVEKMGLEQSIKMGILLKIISIIPVSIIATLNIQSPMIILLALAPGAFGIALIISSGITLAMDHISSNIGTASALIGAFQLLIASLGLGIAGNFYNGNLVPLSVASIIWLILTIGLMGYISKMKNAVEIKV